MCRSNDTTTTESDATLTGLPAGAVKIRVKARHAAATAHQRRGEIPLAGSTNWTQTAFSTNPALVMRHFMRWGR